jgi:hypothetical protein
MYENYFMSNYGSYMTAAHDVIANGLMMKIDSVFFTEAKGVIAGMDSAGYDVDSIDHYDLIASNCLLDLMSAMKMEGECPMGCSSLMSWGQATTGTDLHGHAAITRHLDWNNDPVLLQNQVLVVHLPSEANEQPWAFIGFAGQIAVLSGFNQHIGTFQHMLSDFSGSPTLGTLYEPVWFSLRRALELADPNGDGQNDALDVRYIASQNPSGYADGYIFCTLAPSTSGSANLIAEVAEVTPVSPYLTFRASDFADSIPGDNLYAANYEIKRNNHYHFCIRYNNVISGIGTGENIGIAENWDIMRDYSVNPSPMGNIQMMQFIPEENIFRLSIQKGGMAAYEIAPTTFLLSELFSNPAGVTAEPQLLSLDLWPSPVASKVNFSCMLKKAGKVDACLCNMRGQVLQIDDFTTTQAGLCRFSIDVSKFPEGVYFIKLKTSEGIAYGKFLIMR